MVLRGSKGGVQSDVTKEQCGVKSDSLEAKYSSTMMGSPVSPRLSGRAQRNNIEQKRFGKDPFKHLQTAKLRGAPLATDAGRPEEVYFEDSRVSGVFSERLERFGSSWAPTMGVRADLR